MPDRLNAAFLSPEELAEFGVENAAERNILIHKTAVIVNFEALTLGRNVRIDPFVVISCKDVVLGDYVHIASGCGLFGSARITYGNFSTSSGHCLIYSSSDDYSGDAMTNPTVPAEYLNVESAPVIIGDHCVLGARTTVLPGAHVGEGASIGACSLVKANLTPWTIYAGCPVKPIRERSKACLHMSKGL